MYEFKFSVKGMIAAASAATVALGLSGLATAVQIVAPSLTAAGASINGSTQSVGAGSTFTFFGLYSDDNANPESGLGIKVLYNGTHLTNATITEEYTKCRIAAAQVQDGTTATAKAVMGWIDTAVRPSGVPASATGAVGWPNLADLTTGGCLNPGNINGAANAGDNAGTPAATAGTPLKLFRFSATMAPSCTTPAACTSTVQIVSEGNFSYAGSSPNFTNQSFVVQGAAAPVCNLDVDNSSTSTAFVDGILIVRHLLSLTGASLTNGVAVTGTRSLPADLTTFMSGINWDMTGAGGASAFRDGIIIVRLMLGIPDSILLNGVTIPAGATFQTAAAIRANVNSRCGTTF